jgi:CRISPR-associated protein Csx16
MTTFFVSRHPGAVAWIAAQGLLVDRVVDHIEANHVAAGDTIIGTLPVHLAAAVCERGAIYLHLAVDLLRELRGAELSADRLAELGARLRRFEVRARGCFDSESRPLPACAPLSEIADPCLLQREP